MPGTLVCFHAHPDDEAIMTGGTIARASEAGHRVVVVFATRGELGEILDGVSRTTDELGEHRTGEAERAALALGAQRVAFLGFHDSGMAGDPSNDVEGAFWSTDREAAAARLANLLRDEHAEVLTTYDERGGYEHPDHIKVHEVGLRAAELAGTPRVYCATVSREHFEAVTAKYLDAPDAPDAPDTGDAPLGVEEARITTVVDVSGQLERKRAAMAAHASQIPDSSVFLSLPDDAFADVFGREWFIRVGADPPATDADRDDWLF
ncbi:MAG TPA: PIG-L family deacetylase [Acidimicrobiia bacterium]|nr:PIG-L family deacetylase [Acidimicrobiia bacterium]